MRSLLSSLLVVLLSFGLAVSDAEAKRLGGGKSLGKKSTYASQSYQAPTQNTATTAQRNATTATQPVKQKSGMMKGLLGGLLAGGLLAALFMGEGFEGIQFMDILLIGLLVFLAFKLLRRKQQPQPAGMPSYGAPAEPQPQTRDTGADFNAGVAAPQGHAQPADFAVRGAPEGFDEQGFLERAKGHFSHLQAAWDKGDLEEIREYTTPELFAELQRERAALTEQPQTEVVKVVAEMAGIVTRDNKVEASVLFHGLIKENSDQITEFNETWHLERDLSQPNANWYIAGIEQNG